MGRTDRATRLGILVSALAWALLLSIGITARAQVRLDPDHLISGATTTKTVNAQIQHGAEAQQARGKTAARYALYTVSWPKDGAEFDALARLGVVLVTAITQTQAELPLARAYLVTPDGKQTQLRKLNSWRSAVNTGTLAYTQLGKFREDGFYLVPAAAASRPGEVQLDFAVNRVGFVLMKLPVTAQDFGYALRDPVAGAQPDNAALRKMIAREFPGFPAPKL